MSPRNKWIALSIVAILSLGATAAGQTSLTPETRKNRIIRFYQSFVSGADGNRCPMYPSCSEYAARALRKHGPVMGWIMTCDRLMRCGRSESHLASEIRLQGRTRIYDPVSANDFWWFTPPPDGK